MDRIYIMKNHAGNGVSWLGEGFGYFRAKPMSWIGAYLIMFGITFAVSVVPGVGSIISMFLSVFLSGGLMLGCQAQSKGEEFKVDYLFQAFKKEYFPLIFLPLIYVGLVLVLLIPFVIIMAVLMSAADVAFEMSTLESNPLLALLAFLLILALVLPISMGTWFAPALVVLGGLKPWDAFKISFMGCLGNILPALVYGLFVLFWGILASIPLLLGWLVLSPVLIASTFAAYQNIFKTENNFV